jgi:Flp pilus assembly protein TadG
MLWRSAKRTSGRPGRDEHGQALVEFALLLPVLLLVVVGGLDLARAVWQENTLAHAAREGTRYAIVHGANSTSPVGPSNRQPVIDVVRGAAIGVANVSVDVNWPDMNGGTPCNARPCRVSVEARAPFNPILSEYFLGGRITLTLRGGSSLSIQR